MTRQNTSPSSSHTERDLPHITLATMLRLGLFQIGLGMMSVLLSGLLNRILIKELGVPATLASVVLAITLFVAPLRIWFGQLSDTKPIAGLHRTNYVLLGAISFAVLAFVAVQVMWQVGGSLQATGWSPTTYGWTALLAGLFGLYGIAISASSTPFATLLVDITDEEERSKIVGIDWAMLLVGISIGGIAIKRILEPVGANPSLEVLQSGVNRLFLIIPWVVVGLAIAATWGIEKKYSRYALRSRQINNAEISLKRAWHILTASRQTRFFFSFLIAMTIGLFLQDAILEPYGGEIFKMPAGDTALLNSFWGGGTMIGILGAGFWLTPRFGKQWTAKFGCQLVAIVLFLVVGAGFTGNIKFFQMTLVLFGLASGITTTGAITLMLDLTAAETAGTFIGAWGLAQALSRGISTVLGGTALDVGKKITGEAMLAYGGVFILQSLAMVVAIVLLKRVNVQEFQTSSQDAIKAVIASDLD